MLSADEIKNAWKKCYGEDLSKEYSGLWNLIKNTSVPINKLISNWSTVYGENMVEKYSGFFDEIVRDEKLYESSKPNGSKLSDEDYEKLIGLAKVNSIDDLIEKGYDKSDVISASHASLKRSGIKLAKDGDRKGDDPSDKQYKDRVIKTNESISQDILVYLYANKEPLTVEKISDYIDGGKSPKSVEKELNKYVKNGHVTKEEDGYKITEKGKDLRKSWINENNGLDFSIISTDGLNFMKTALEKDPTKLTSQEICDEIGNMYDEDPGTFKVGEEQEVDGIKIVQSIGKENEKEYFFVGTNDQAKAKKVFSKSKFINESKSEETFLGNLVFYLEDEEKGATKKELISFEKITRKYINDFKYLDYLSTGGGKSTAANLVKKFKEDRLSLKDYIDELKTAFKDKLDTIKKINENSTTKSEYVVNVGNVGNVLSTTDYDEAKKTYDEYVEISNSGVGKAGNETVYLLKDGEPIKEHQGSINESKEVKDGDLKEIEKEIYDTFGLGGDQKVIHINDLIDNIVPEIYPNGKNNEELAEQVATLLTKNGWSVERPMGEAIEGKKIFKYESWKKAVEKIAKGLVDFVEKGDYENAVSTKTNKVLGYWKKDDETGLVYENKIKLMFNNKINEAKILNEFNNSYLVEVGNTQEVYTREELQNLVPGSKN
jgi:DNA-binding PadR family transcriptional regulator